MGMPCTSAIWIPNRPGLEVFQVHEDRSARYGASLHDAATGEILWGAVPARTRRRGMAADIDPRYPGEEVWARPASGFYCHDGTRSAARRLVGQLRHLVGRRSLRELLDQCGSAIAVSARSTSGITKTAGWSICYRRRLPSRTTGPRAIPASRRTSLATGGKRSSGARRTAQR